MAIGETLRLSVTARFSDGSSQVVENALVEWRSSGAERVVGDVVPGCRAGPAESLTRWPAASWRTASGGAKSRWRAVRTTLASTCCVSAPVRDGVG